MIPESVPFSSDKFDWDAFWAFTGRQKLFNWLLYQLHYRQYKKLLKGLPFANIALLELGAGTGIITQRLVQKFGGRCVLVDDNELAYRLFLQNRQTGVDVNYLRTDIFDLDLTERFDLVCSDGLIEHFKDKAKIIELHRWFVKPEGHIIIFVPKDTWFLCLLQRFGPTFGYEEWFSLPELKKLCSLHGLKVIRSVDYFFEVGVLCRVEMPGEERDECQKPRK